MRGSAQRFRSEQPGIETWHSFSAGAHYDPDAVAFGPLIAFDEHHLEPGAEFPRHPHRDMEIVSYVVSGTLRHDDGERTAITEAGGLFYQSAGAGIEHVEGNASAAEPLTFIQMWLHPASTPPAGGRPVRGPVLAGTGALFVTTGPLIVEAASAYVHVLSGALSVKSIRAEAGDALLLGNRAVALAGDAVALCWLFPTLP